MNKSVSAMKSIEDICASLRRKYYGNSSTAKDYKDSYVINNAISLFPISAYQALMAPSLTEKDKAEGKIAKSINYRSDCLKKISDISKMLAIPEAEVMRRILYYSLENGSTHSDSSPRENQLFNMKNKVVLLKTQMEEGLATLDGILHELEQLLSSES